MLEDSQTEGEKLREAKKPAELRLEKTQIMFKIGSSCYKVTACAKASRPLPMGKEKNRVLHCQSTRDFKRDYNSLRHKRDIRLI